MTNSTVRQQYGSTAASDGALLSPSATNAQDVKAAFANIAQVQLSLNASAFQEIAQLRRAPQPVKNVLIAFGNFYKLGGSVMHTWSTVLTAIKNYRSVMCHLANFNYNNVPRN